MAAVPVLIRDLIDIPEQVHRGDFVLRLTEGIQRPDDTLRDSVRLWQEPEEAIPCTSI